MTNRISALPPEAVQAAKDALDAFRTAVEPHTVEISAEERRDIVKLGDRTVAFAEKAVRYAKERPELVPAFLDADEMGSDLDTYRTLTGLADRLRQLESLVRDSAMVAGGEAHEGAYAFYGAVKAAAKSGVPSADVVRDDLGSRWARQRTSAPAGG